jgi:hypothetical protein
LLPVLTTTRMTGSSTSGSAFGAVGAPLAAIGLYELLA